MTYKNEISSRALTNLYLGSLVKSTDFIKESEFTANYRETNKIRENSLAQAIKAQ